jgi:hypothetical protein
MDLVSCSFTLEQISVGMGIPERTLSRHFAQELATGKLRVHAEIAAAIVAAARKGDKTMRIFYAKSQLGWRERTSVSFEGEDGQAMSTRQLFHIQISNSASREDPQ